ncbi:phosphoenolpyruvate synthase [Actinocorallia aurantiaca]|uniref:Phosphoenolpyruvate synthase n=1 Tax=Actinocorallia aurantiaca TaxID=46204 RepID=A0ABN3UA78_9ACTN
MSALGGKGENLRRLTGAGLRVPAWSAVGLDVLRDFRDRSGLGQELAGLLAGLDPDNAWEVSARIAKAFSVTPLDGPALSAIWRAYDEIGQGPVAVRSSGADEDLPNFSFAGQYSSFLGVEGFDAVAEKVRECWASAYSARSLVYRWLHDLPTDRIDLAVVLQELVPAEVSGVMFTADPVSGDRSRAIISCVYGLGETLVSGQVDADTLTLDRPSRVVGDAVIGEKAERLDAGPGGTALSPVSSFARERFALTNEQVGELGDLAEEIEDLFGAPQDVEWALRDGVFHVLQSRPITTLREAEGEVRVWDNSNIIESFGEVTAPLTFSFARHVYQRVYRDYVRLLGVPRRDLAKMDGVFGEMLGYFDGRVYYNVLNWYKIIRLLPGYALNRKILAAAMGVRETSEELALAQHPIESPLRERLVRLRVALRFLRMFFTVRRSVASFTDHFHQAYEEFDSVDYDTLPGHEVDRALRRLEERLLSRWGATAVLDNVIMLSYGVLHGLNAEWLPDAPEWFLWEAVKVGDDVESTAPARRLGELAGRLAERPELAEAVRESPADELWEWLRAAEGEDAEWLRAELDGFLAAYGYRSANELKLEEPDLHDDPSLLMSMLKDALLIAGVASAPQTEHDADAYLRERLNGPKLFVYDKVRGKVREALRERERVRFARTRAFGMARRMFKAMGRDLESAGALGARRDVFFLKLEEIRAAYAGTMNHRELRPLAELRKKQQAKQRLMPAPPPRFLTRGSVYWGVQTPDPAPAGEEGADVLRGTPCSPGVVTARARVVDSPRDVGGGVLVAYRTDPGWVGALSSAAALLIERGSPLTHVAIVARELGVPTVVQIPGLTERVEDGMTLTVDGGTGVVRIEKEDG